MLTDQRFRHPVAEVVAAAFGDDLALDEAGGGTHTAGEVPEPKPEGGAVEVRLGGPGEEGFQLP